MGTITYDDVGNRLIFQNGKFYLNAQNGDDFLVGDLLDINSFEFSISQPLEGIIALGQKFSGEPVLSEVIEVSLKVGFPKYQANQQALITALMSETEKKAKFEVTGADIVTGKPYKLTLYFPRLKVKSFGLGYEDIIKSDVEFIPLQASVAPTGMSDTKPYMVLVNKRTTDYLA